MMWQDLVFLVGSSLSIVFLAPTLRDAASRVPLGTSLPSMAIGAVYAGTFATLGMTFSAVGSAAAATMWSLIALYRSPAAQARGRTHLEDVFRAISETLSQAKQRVTGLYGPNQHATEGDYGHTAD